jgi:hypothetical protein
MAANDSLIKGSVTLFYLLIGLEIVIMISPFAGYFYAGYGPLLDFLYGNKTTAWLTGFFRNSHGLTVNTPRQIGHWIFQ